MKPTYIELYYNNADGYSLRFTFETGRYINVRFCELEPAKEYIGIKVGKIIAKKFDRAFEDIRNLIIAAPNYTSAIRSKTYYYKNGEVHTLIENPS